MEGADHQRVVASEIIIIIVIIIIIIIIIIINKCQRVKIKCLR